MSTVSQTTQLVKTLRGGYATADPQCFCQCGKFCPGANACAPVKGPVHQPYWTIREAVTPRGRRWAGCLYDPQAQTFPVHTLFGRWYATPCQAVDVLVSQALRSQQYPIRLDLAVTDVDLAALEATLAQRLFDTGYGLFLEHGQSPALLRHPLIAAGYAVAQAEAEAALVEEHPGFDFGERAVWVVSTAPAAAP